MVFGYVYETGKRACNEDALLFRSSLFAGGELCFAAVCDGMGGMDNGMEAAGFCIGEMESWFDRQLIPLIGSHKAGGRDMKSAIRSKGFCLYRRMNRALFEQMRQTGKRMGTTALMCVIYRQRFYLFHIGDSRGYLVRRPWNQKRFLQLTKDHGNEKGLFRCIGLNREWKPDFMTGRLGKAGILLCTDGFYRAYNQKVWNGCLNPKKLREEDGIRKRLREIADYNLRQGERDNISALYMGGETGKSKRKKDG